VKSFLLANEEDQTMDYVEALNEITEDHPKPYVFLGGGITDCPDWQAQVVEMLKDFPHGTLINPRQSQFDMEDPQGGLKQISWEFDKIWEKCAIFTMWFCKETIGPICLFELGSALGRQRVVNQIFAQRFAFAAIIVGGDPEYSRKLDVEVQTALALGEEIGSTPLHCTLEEHAEYIRQGVQKYLDTMAELEVTYSEDDEADEDDECPHHDSLDLDAEEETDEADEFDEEETESDLQAEEE
jgi:Arc/MetJ-type ribon-helix-helix transcriptional regulator